MKARFGVYELDDEVGELRRGGEAVAIQPKPFALLALLIRERDRVVPTNELFETLWPDTVVSPGSLNRAVSHARRAIDDTGRGDRIKSVARRGYRFMGEVQLIDPAGAADPNDASDEAGEASAALPPPDDEHRGLPFVGRRHALEQLERSFERVVAGEPCLYVVSGKAGVGKTRLTEIFTDRAYRRGAYVVTGRCRDRDGVPAFWLWTQVLRQLRAGKRFDDVLDVLDESFDLAELSPDLGKRGPPRKSPSELPADQQRFLFFEAATRALLACARRQPLLLVLEDLQWAGQASLRLLEHIACEVGGAPLMILATVRDEPRERGDSVDATLAVLRQQAGSQPIELSGLSRGEVGAWLSAVSGKPVPVDLTSELYARTEGVPFFVREAIHLLEERGSLEHPERIPRHGITLPSHATDLLRRAIDGLSPDCAAFLEAAAVLGRDFLLTQVAAVAECDRLAALDWLDEALRAGIVSEPEEGVAAYRFAHALYQEAIYDAIRPGRRARLHRRAAERLEAQHAGDLRPVLAELAHHHHHSIAVGDPEHAFELAWQAAEHAERLFAYEQAAVHYEQARAALDHCDSVVPQRRLDTLLALGAAHRLSGEPVKRRDAYALAAEIASGMNDADALARAAIGLCDLGEWALADERTSARVDEALERLEEAHSVHRARLTTRSAYLDIMRPERAEPQAREAVALARACGDPEALQEALYILHYVLAGPDHLAERREIIVELGAAAASADNRDTAVIALLDIACDALMEGDAARACQLRGRAGAIGGEHPSPSMVWHTRVWDTGLALLEGRLEEVEPRARNALLLGQRIRHPFSRSCFNAQMLLLDREAGRHHRIVDSLKGVLRARASATHWATAALARAYLASGDRERAETLFEQLVDDGGPTFARNIRWTATLVETAHLCAELEDATRARVLLDALRTTPDHHGVLPVPITYGGPVTYCVARLQTLTGDADDALAAYDEAIASARALGARPTLARIELHRAPLLRRAGRRDQARQALAHSIEIASELGMSEVAALASRELERS